MRRTARLAFGCVALVVATTALAQTTPTATTEYFPLKVGSKWTYKVADNSITVKVASADAYGAVLDTLVNDKSVATEVIQVKPDGVYRSKINKTDISPPVKFLGLKDGKPEAVGTSWKVDSKVSEQPLKGEFKHTADKEKVKVPAAEYEAVVVDGPGFEIAGTKTGIKYWFAPKVGIVKLAYNIAGNEAVLELKEYSEAK
jgi:hypothetical protein